MYRIKLIFSNNLTHSYLAEDNVHVESLKQHMLNRHMIELNDEESGDTIIINPDHVITVSIEEAKE